MINPILAQIDRNQNGQPRTQVSQTQMPQNEYIQQLTNTLKVLKNSPNQQAMLQNLVLQNPRLKEAMNFIQQNKTPEQAFYNMARARGFNPDEILKAIKSL